jgi:hypothetical protein
MKEKCKAPKKKRISDKNYTSSGMSRFGHGGWFCTTRTDERSVSHDDNCRIVLPSYVMLHCVMLRYVTLCYELKLKTHYLQLFVDSYCTLMTGQ